MQRYEHKATCPTSDPYAPEREGWELVAVTVASGMGSGGTFYTSKHRTFYWKRPLGIKEVT